MSGVRSGEKARSRAAETISAGNARDRRSGKPSCWLIFYFCTCGKKPPFCHSVRQKGGFLPRFSRIPAEVLADRRLKLDHIRVYGAIASSIPRGSFKSNTGQRLIAKIAFISARTVGRRLQELQAFGHLKIVHVEQGKRATYEMTSEVFTKDKVRSFGSQRKERGSGVRTAARMWAQSRQNLDDVFPSAVKTA